VERAAEALREKAITRFGFITTNSITQNFNRRVLQRAIDHGSRIVWAIPNHPWSDSETGAAVRIAMTVASNGLTEPARLESVVSEVLASEDDDTPVVTFAVVTDKCIHADLRTGAGVASVTKLRANATMAAMGVALHGAGFLLDPDKARMLRQGDDDPTIRRYTGGRDLLQIAKERYVIDFSFQGESEARKANPAAFQHLIDHVLPERRLNQRAVIRERWWRFGWERPGIRQAIVGLGRFIVTTETAKNRVFQMIPADVLPDHMVVIVASDDALHLGVLSSRIHVTWALAAGGGLGVGNDPRYNKTRCFDPFPFPDATPDQARAHP
jgi:hypothetical protein